MKLDGGPAFPQAYQPRESNVGGYVPPPVPPGMTLRDYFAAAALPAIIGGAARLPGHIFENKSSAQAIAMLTTTAYLYADAMLAERAK